MVGFVDRCPLLEKDLDHLGPALATSSGQHYNESWIIGMSLNVVNKDHLQQPQSLYEDFPT